MEDLHTGNGSKRGREPSADITSGIINPTDSVLLSYFESQAQSAERVLGKALEVGMAAFTLFLGDRKEAREHAARESEKNRSHKAAIAATLTGEKKADYY